MFKLKLHWQILIALVLGVVIGTVLQATQGEEVKNNGFVSFMEFMGSTVFIGLLKMVIVPLIFSSIVAGIAGRDKSRGFGRLGVKTLAYYISSSAIAIIIPWGFFKSFVFIKELSFTYIFLYSLIFP